MNVEVQVVVPWELLVDPDGARAGFVEGEPVPGDLVRDMITSTQGRVWWRRLFTMPSGEAWATDLSGGVGPVGRDESGGAAPRGSGRVGVAGPQPRVIVRGDQVKRRFDGWLTAMIRARGQRCRDPFCDAPIRHIDHVERHRDGGETSWENGRGVCARGNYVREMPGWRVEVVEGGTRGSPHRVRTTTPTGHVYESCAPDPC